MAQIFTDRIILSQLYENGIPCVIQSIRVESLGGVHIPCIYSQTDFTVQFQEDMQGQCIRIIVQCDNCGMCEPHIIEKCFCKTNGDCANCSTCGTDGFCKSICPDKLCINNNVCADCSDPSHCRGGKICSGGKCVCPSGTYENEFEQCVECLNAGHCPACNNCIGYECEVKDCLGQFLNPSNCDCQECLDSADCKTKDPNSCCDNGVCKCCPGYMVDPVQNKCVPKPDCGPGSGVDTPPCYTCIDGSLIAISCPPGKVRTNDPNNCCKTACDCNNPNCAGLNEKCVQPSNGNCYCENCDKPCGDGICNPGCICNPVTKRCQKNDCDRPCDANNPCPYGCGCKAGRCQPCNTLTCDECGQVPGCLCDSSTNNVCAPKPCSGPCTNPSDCPNGNCGCNPALLVCEPCDRPCVGNDDCQWGCYCDKGTKRCKKNPCWKPCSNGVDCDPGCGCYKDKGCYPCSSFDCTTCPSVSGCKCIDGVNCAGGPRECQDLLQIIKHDDACTLEGKLTTKDCCACTDLGYYVKGIAAGFPNTVQWVQKLKKGHTVASPDLDLTGISNDFPVLSGTVVYDINVHYNSGAALTIATGVTVDWSFRTPNLFDPIYNILCSNGPDEISRIDFIFGTDMDFESASGCKYFIQAGTIVTVYGCNAGVEVVIPFNKRLGCKRPIFSWYKETAGVYTKFHEAYGIPAGVNMYSDTVDASEGLEICHGYKLNVDCGCDRETFYSCYNDELRPTQLTMCNPTDLVVNENQALCNTQITISETNVCSLMNGQTYRLYINDIFEANIVAVGGKIFVGGLVITKLVPITSLRLEFPCDDCDLCTIRKNFSAISPCNCATTPLAVSLIGAPDCATGFSYQITGDAFPMNVIVVRTVPPQDHEYDNFTHSGPNPTTYTFNGPLENGDWYIKVTDAYGCEKIISFNINCCDLGNPSVNYECSQNRIVINSVGNIPTEYNLGGAGWFILGASKVIPAVLANGVYPGYVCLRRLDNHACTQCFDLTVDCDTCLLAISTASLNATCDMATVNSTPVWDEFSLNGTGSWTAGIYPTVPLPAPLTPGSSVTIYVRDSTNPTCYRSVVLFCNNCQPINIGTPVITHNCATGDLGITGLLNPPVPPFDPACTYEIIYNVNGVITITTDSVTFWGTTIISLHNQFFTQANNVVSATINVICNGKRCALATVTQNFPTVDDLGTVTYNCTDPNKGLRWTGSSVQVQVLISGIWTNVSQGHILNNGTFQVRSITGGLFCTIQKTVNVPCLGGPGGGDPCTDFGSYFSLISADPCDSTVSLQLSAAAPYSAAVTIKVLEGTFNGTCDNQGIFSSAQITMVPGGSASFGGIPITNRTRVIHYQLLGFPGDGCICDTLLSTCGNGGSCGIINLAPGNLACIVNGANRRVNCVNPNLVSCLLYVDSGSGMQYKATISPGNAHTVTTDYPPGTLLTCRLVCLNDPTSFSGDVNITLSC